MNYTRNFLLLFVFCSALSVQGQVFLKPEPGKGLTFKEMQRQFNDWAKKTDLSKTRYWKYFKRWEMEMTLHTDATGEPADPAIYVQGAIQAANEKMRGSNARFSANAWYPVGPTSVPNNQTGYMENGIGRINCIAFHPTSTSTYFVGVAQGGVWKTTNNGQSWTPLTDNLPITRISDIAIDPTNPTTMYISVCDFEYIGSGLKINGRNNTHFGLGVYKTIDGGATWNPTGLSFQMTQGDVSLIRKIMVNPANSNNVIACGVNGMYTSGDAGLTWTRVVNELFWDMVQDPGNANTLYAATGWVKNSNTGKAGIYKSTNFGATWTALTTNIPQTGTVQRIKLAVAPSDPNYVYAIAVDTDNGLHGIYKTTNAGTSWQIINPGVNVLEAYNGSGTGGQGNYDLALMVDRNNRDLVFSGGVNIWGSADGAQSFSPVSHWTTSYGPTLHGDIHFIEQQPVTGAVFVCNDGGLYRTTNLQLGNWNQANSGIPWPTQWTNISNGMAITSFYRISSSKNTTGRIVAGAQDNATFYFDGTSWSTILGGDGMDNYIDPGNNSELIGSSQYGNFYLHASNLPNLSPLSSSLNPNNETGEWTTPLVANYNQPGTLYVGFENVMKSTNGGLSWNKISNFPRGFNQSEICALAASHANNNVVYAARRARLEYNILGTVYRTSNGGNTWTDITAGLPDSVYYTSMEADETDANTAYITIAGFLNGKKVYRTTNGGASWQNISYNLANVPVNRVKRIPGKNYTVLATDFGVYVLPDGTTTWINQSQGLPNVIVSDIEFNPSLNKIYITTFGRGIWATDLDVFVSGMRSAKVADAGIDLYPSPNNGSFTLKFPAGKTARETYQLEVIDITGKVVYKAALTGKVEYRQQLNVPAGLYFAKITGKKTYSVKRFIVE
ncbi:T9SS type A sorting domain-containing protein [Adhaeribacter soli]|uniref:T9SS type A sorting domain-containing protein n=1 Tax=Adhaeribacter soli TaxID=2607655 RepID=A0A5N1IQC4_9BACT|nr:T9SS type A sorting domain-containing protein [Adhaeribacter soli]KAA9331163.1 T9SS type A sorting domain-containing protein [Adhaeribacter soli]